MESIKIDTVESCQKRINNIKSNIDSTINNLSFLDEIGHPSLIWFRSSAQANIDMMKGLIKIEQEKIKSIQN